MTDRRSRAARWTAAALVAPASAAVFLGATHWSVTNTPTGAKAPGGTVVVSGYDPTTASLRAQIAAGSAEVKALRKKVAATRSRAARIAGGTGTASSSGSASTTGGSSGSTSGGSSGSTVVRAPAPVAPAPPVHTSTGASGGR